MQVAKNLMLQLEQWINIKLCQKLEKSVIKTLQMVQQENGIATMAVLTYLSGTVILQKVEILSKAICT